MSRKPEIEKLKTGLTGEYLVAGIMQMKGWISSLTLKNYPGVDIFGRREVDGIVQHADIQVKTTRDNTFWVGVKHSDLDSEIEKKIKGPYVLVHLPKEESDDERKTQTNLSGIDFYILSQKQIIKLIRDTDDAYQKKDRGEKKLKDDYSVAILLKRDRELLKPFKDQWENLWVED